MTESPRMDLLLGVALVAFLAGFAVGDMPLPDVGPDADRDRERPHAMAQSGPGCLDEDPEEPTGWLHVVADGETYDVTMDARIAHDSGNHVELRVHETSPGSYAVDLRAVTDTDRTGKATPSEDCRIGTELNLGTSVPTDFEQIEVLVDGRLVTTVEKRGTTARLVRLPTPIAA